MTQLGEPSGGGETSVPHRCSTTPNAVLTSKSNLMGDIMFCLVLLFKNGRRNRGFFFTMSTRKS